MIDPAKLAAALTRWEGTPFLEGGHACQRGVDCVYFVREILRESGVDVSPAARIPRYNVFAGRHHTHTPLLAWLTDDPSARANLRRLDEEDPLESGDILAVKVSVGVHHLAIVGAEQPRPMTAWHVPIGGSVGAVPLAHVLENWKIPLRLRYGLPRS